MASMKRICLIFLFLGITGWLSVKSYAQEFPESESIFVGSHALWYFEWKPPKHQRHSLTVHLVDNKVNLRKSLQYNDLSILSFSIESHLALKEKRSEFFLFWIAAGQKSGWFNQGEVFFDKQLDTFVPVSLEEGRIDASPKWNKYLNDEIRSFFKESEAVLAERPSVKIASALKALRLSLVELYAQIATVSVESRTKMTTTWGNMKTRR
jgi:hypothetical protein